MTVAALIFPTACIIAIAVSAALCVHYAPPYEVTTCSSDSASSPSAMTTQYLQRTFSLTARKRGCHLVTDELLSHIQPDLASFSVGLAHLFIQHTSASLTINENADSDVRLDMEAQLNRLVPSDQHFRHDAEGDDDMPAHVKASLMDSGVTLPIRNGRLALGTWQGVWLCEHRDHGGSRHVVVTMHGAVAEGKTGKAEKKDGR